MEVLEIVGYIASILMGLSLGLIGGGGSILTVPILVYFFSIEPILSTSYSLFIVGLTALIGGVGHIKSGNVNFKIGFIFAVPSLIGVYTVRAFIVPSLPDVIFQAGSFAVTKSIMIMGLFALLMLVASISMIRGRKENSQSAIKEIDVKRSLIIAAEGLFVGGITGLVGAGGGFLIIPALVILVGLPMKMAVGTSLFIISVKSLLGFTGDIQTGIAIDWQFLLILSAIAVVGVFIGKSLSSKVSNHALKKGFGFFVLVMGSFVLFDQIRALL